MGFLNGEVLPIEAWRQRAPGNACNISVTILGRVFCYSAPMIEPKAKFILFPNFCFDFWFVLLCFGFLILSYSYIILLFSFLSFLSALGFFSFIPPPFLPFSLDFLSSLFFLYTQLVSSSATILKFSKLFLYLHFSTNKSNVLRSCTRRYETCSSLHRGGSLASQTQKPRLQAILTQVNGAFFLIQWIQRPFDVS